MRWEPSASHVFQGSPDVTSNTQCPGIVRGTIDIMAPAKDIPKMPEQYFPDIPFIPLGARLLFAFLTADMDGNALLHFAAPLSDGFHCADGNIIA